MTESVDERPEAGELLLRVSAVMMLCGIVRTVREGQNSWFVRAREADGESDAVVGGSWTFDNYISETGRYIPQLKQPSLSKAQAQTYLKKACHLI